MTTIRTAVADDAWASKDDGPEYPIDSDEHVMIVAERDGSLAGFGDLHVSNAEGLAVYVHPDHAHCGVGSAIVSHLESVAQETI